jgi:hypothetical protein
MFDVTIVVVPVLLYLSISSFKFQRRELTHCQATLMLVSNFTDYYTCNFKGRAELDKAATTTFETLDHLDSALNTILYGLPGRTGCDILPPVTSCPVISEKQPVEQTK